MIIAAGQSILVQILPVEGSSMVSPAGINAVNFGCLDRNHYFLFEVASNLS
jgi:hypothetical protein